MNYFMHFRKPAGAGAVVCMCFCVCERRRGAEEGEDNALSLPENNAKIQLYLMYEIQSSY